MSEISFDKMTVPLLREALEARGLDSKGLKAVLVKRLKDADAKGVKPKEKEEDEEEEEVETKSSRRAPKRKAAEKKVEKEEEDEDDDDDDDEEPASKKVKEEKKPRDGVAKKLTKAKVDVHCPKANSAVVHSAGSDTYDVMLNQTNIAQNNNKYYLIQLLESGGSYWTWNRWGRVGEARAGATKLAAFGGSFNSALKDFEKKFKSKTGNDWDKRDQFKPKSGKYTMLEMSYSDDEEEQEEVINQALASKEKKKQKVRPCSLDASTQGLMRLIFDNDMFKEQLQSFNIDVKKMPLGKISKNQLAKGFEVLEELKGVLEGKNPSSAKINSLSSDFYTRIPHDFGRRIPTPLNTLEAVQQKMDLLEVLGDIVVAQNMLKDEKTGEIPDEIDHPLDQNYKKLGNNMNLVDKNSKEFKLIETYTYNTMGKMRTLKLLDAWEIDRSGEFTRFSETKSLGNRKLLWHGTNVAVIVAILTTGLRIMPHSGGRVGRGLYFASENLKSAGYVGTTRESNRNIGFMFLNEVALGKENQIVQDDSSLRHPPKGYDSVVAMGRTEPNPKDDTTIPGKFGDVVVPLGKAINRPEYSNSSFFNSEYLVYNENQVYSRYLLKLDFS